VGVASASYATTATLDPSSNADMNARATGVVRELLHEEGDDVEAGQTLLRLEDDDQRLRVRKAEQDLSSAKREFDRLSQMKGAGLVSPTDIETAESAYLQAQTELELAKLALSYTRIAAPFSGRVVWREVDLGAQVRDGDLLFRMMAINPLLVRVHIPANRMGTVAVGQPVSLGVDSVDQVLTGQIELVSPIVDPGTGTVKVTVVLDDYPDGVRPGDFAEVEIVTEQRNNALLLPSTAVIEERGQHILYLADGDKASRRDVEIGFVVGDQTEILTGIDAGARVIVKGQRNLSDGAPIEELAQDAGGVESTAQVDASGVAQ
jgi:RND family efflux transporter MFP subunit